MTEKLGQLHSLQKRIREATGPDRFLDADIWRKLIGDVLPPKNYPKLTLDPDGLGPCVALMREVLPGWRRSVSETANLFHIVIDPIDEAMPTRGSSHALETHATLLAIVSALIAQEEAKEPVKC